LRPREEPHRAHQRPTRQPTGIVTGASIIDPATGQPTDDPLAGFLPPNKTAPEGEGNVFFTVMPKGDLPTGAEIRNDARIFFDTNEPIDTPVWLNTIDNSNRKPGRGARCRATSARFEVRWAGTDTGAGIARYDIFVSENEGPYTVWQQNTTATSAIYEGEINTRYRFLLRTAADGASNLEDAPADADASTATPNISVQFSAAAYTFNESEAANGARLTVTRTGDATGTTTIAMRPLTTRRRCAATRAAGPPMRAATTATTVDTITFAPGETTRPSVIPLIDDAHVEDAETFSVRLSNLTGGGILGAAQTTVVTLQDNDTAGQANPIFNNAFFVRQHYLDFLSREPEEGGLNAWLNVLNNCSNVNNNPACDRITVSSSFFPLSGVSTQGLYVYLFYRVGPRPATGLRRSRPRHALRHRADARRGLCQARRLRRLVRARPELRGRYDNLSNAAYVDALLNRYGLASITTLIRVAPTRARKFS
jgi:hypothetical protein